MSWRHTLLSVALGLVAIIVGLGFWFGEWFALGFGVAGVLTGHVALTYGARRQRTHFDNDTVEQILARFPGPVVLAPSRVRAVSKLMLVVMACGAAAWAILAFEAVVTRLLLAAFMLMLTCVGLFLLIKTQPRFAALRLDDSDLEIRNIRSHRVRWSDSSDFVVAPAPAPLVVFDDHGRKDRFPPVKAWGGRNSAVPNYSTLSLADLALVLNGWRERALLSQGGPEPR